MEVKRGERTGKLMEGRADKPLGLGNWIQEEMGLGRAQEESLILGSP